MSHNRRDWYQTQRKIENKVYQAFLEMRRVPKIREVAEKFGLCIRTIKLHKPFINLTHIPGMTPEHVQMLTRKWQGKHAA